MAKTTKIGATLLVAAAMILVALPLGTNGQSPMAAQGPFAPAPSPGVDCYRYLLNLTDCLTYVEVGSNLTKPEKGCCPELANLVNFQPICLCELLANPNQSPFSIDLTKALRLPSVCKVHTPPLSACAAVGVPIGSPSAGPVLAPIGSPSGLSTGILSPEGSASTPPSPNNGHSGQRTPIWQRHSLVGLAIVFFISLF